MKKIYLIFTIVFVLAMELVSCSSEEAVAKERTEAFKFSKTNEMLDFERTLKTYLTSKQEKGAAGAKTTSDNSQAMKESALQLLKSLGKQELTNQENIETEQLLLVAMKEYSIKLTEMYNQRNSNKK